MKYFNSIIILISMFFSGCSSSVKFTAEESPRKETKKTSPVVIEQEEKDTPNIPEVPIKQEAPRFEDISNVPDEQVLESITGVASYYGKKFHGRKTASGEKYDMNEYTAAHGSYPFHTIVKITNLSNNKSVKVRINDRKPSLHGRLIDLSFAAAKELDFIIKGIAEVRVDVISWGNKNRP